MFTPGLPLWAVLTGAVLPPDELSIALSRSEVNISKYNFYWTLLYVGSIFPVLRNTEGNPHDIADTRNLRRTPARLRFF